MTDVFILEYVRTARGKGSANGALHHLSPVSLVVALQHALVERTRIDPGTVDDVVLGAASQVGEQGANLARTASPRAGWGDTVPGVTVNRFCASGIDAVAQAAARVRAGDIDLAVAGGVESVSRVPMFSDNGPLWTESVHMGIAADLNATLDGWTRDELDAYGLESQTKAARAWDAGRYDREVAPLTRADGTTFGADELIRRTTTRESLAALPPAFAELGRSGQDAVALAAHPGVGAIDHRHTVGTSPALADGAALLLLGSAAAAGAAGLRPRARVLAAATAGADPVIMLTAGQSAVEKVIARAGLRPADVDVFEFAEAFAALCLRFRRDLSAGPERMNPNGGTIAMGHAFGATGAIMVGGCVDELERRGGRYGVAAVSGAAGVGVAVLLERVP